MAKKGEGIYALGQKKGFPNYAEGGTAAGREDRRHNGSPKATLVEAAKAVAVVAAADETLVAVLVVSKRSRWDLVFHVYPEGVPMFGG